MWLSIVTPTMETNPSIDLAAVYDRFRPVMPHAFFGGAIVFFSFVGLFLG